MTELHQNLIDQVIGEMKQQQKRLHEAISALQALRGIVPAKTTKRKRHLSKAALQNIRDAQKTRWRKWHLHRGRKKAA